MGALDCAMRISVQGKDDSSGLILTEAHGGLGCDMYITVSGDKLSQYRYEEYIYETPGYVSTKPEGWYALQGSSLESLLNQAGNPRP